MSSPSLDEILLKGPRIVIPSALLPEILERLHTGHQGIVKCRESAKCSVWWPGLSRQLQELVENSEECSKQRNNCAEPLVPSVLPERPWQKVGADLFEWQGTSFLIVVDYFSRYVETPKLPSTTSAAVITPQVYLRSPWHSRDAGE